MTQPSYPCLASRTVWITGGASGIGADFVAGFLAQGARVGFFDRDRDAGQALAAETGAHFVPVDLADGAALSAAAETLAAGLGWPDILVNNAATDYRHCLDDLSTDEWDHGQALNLRAQAFMAKAVLARMRARADGVILNLTSNSALLGLEGYPGYVAAKAGIIGLTKALARAEGRHGIRVNAIAPGWVMTARQRRDWVTPEALAETLKSQSIPEEIQLSHVTALALFLASSGARMITGQTLVVDGGRT